MRATRGSRRRFAGQRRPGTHHRKLPGIDPFGAILSGLVDPDHPLESLADYCLGCYTNLNLPSRVDMICRYIDEYQADGLLINSIKSCNSFSAGQLAMLREIEQRTGKPGGFIESDLVDPRYFSAANIKNRLESYFQMLDQKRLGAAS